MRRRPPAATPPCTYRLRFLVGARGMSTGSRQGTDRTRPPCRLTRDLGRDCVWSLLCDRSVVGLSRPRSRELSDDVACGAPASRHLSGQRVAGSSPASGADEATASRLMAASLAESLPWRVGGHPLQPSEWPSPGGGPRRRAPAPFPWRSAPPFPWT